MDETDRVTKSDVIITIIVCCFFLFLFVIDDDESSIMTNDFDIKTQENFKSINEYNFYKKTLYEPILFSPLNNQNQNAFMDIIDISDSSYIKRYENKYDFEFYVKPKRFYTNLENLNVAYYRYYHTPTKKNAYLLTKQQRLTIMSYIEDINTFIDNEPLYEDIDFVNEYNVFLNKFEMNAYLLYGVDKFYDLLTEVDERYNLISYGETVIEEPYQPNLNDYKEYNPANILNQSMANKMFSVFTYYSPHKQDKIKKTLRLYDDQFKLYYIDSRCYKHKDIPVYGIDGNFYSNIFFASINSTGPDLVDRYKVEEDFDMSFTFCKCPYIEEDRIQWYLINHFVKELKGKNIDEYETKFLNNPSTHNIKLLGKYYKYKFFNTQDIKYWVYYNQIQTPLFLLVDSANNIDVKIHFDQYSCDDCKEGDRMQSLYIIDSFYSLYYPHSMFGYDDYPITFKDYDTSVFYQYNLTDPIDRINKEYDTIENIYIKE